MSRSLWNFGADYHQVVEVTPACPCEDCGAEMALAGDGHTIDDERTDEVVIYNLRFECYRCTDADERVAQGLTCEPDDAAHFAVIAAVDSGDEFATNFTPAFPA